ncbi:MAG: ribose-phosphate pyrophosphokinase [Chitinivibrionales bacterium]|nr:ribose-phosphate pyrophosphokinase [Chitinivibrionales bacterium]
MDRFVVTGNHSDSPVAYDIGQVLGVPFDISDMVSLKTFANGEFCPRYIPDGAGREIGTGLRGKTVIICSASGAMYTRNELAMRNLILARAAKENDAQRVILFEPDLFYAAQDRGPHRVGEAERERPEEDLRKFDGQPFTSKLYAEMLRAAGVDTVLTVHLHSKKVHRLYSDVFADDFHDLIPSELYAHYIKSSDFVRSGNDGDNLVLCAPDKGATPFVQEVWEKLGLRKCRRLIMDKSRTGERAVSMRVSRSSDCGIDDLRGRDVIMLDDMVRTGTTIVECSRMLREGSPNKVCFCVTHFHPSREARENMNVPEIDEILTTSTIPSILNRDSQGRLRRKLAVIKIGKWVGAHILHMVGLDSSHFTDDFYAVDMSSKNPRWRGN